jgi:choline dehydrogenase-like flavoprotein
VVQRIEGDVVGQGRTGVSEHFDAVIVGSGFGGSVMAYRLAEAGKHVCVLERGKAYPPGSFPRTPDKMGKNFFHPLGGCPMASSPQYGVVDAFGEVFGHPGLYIADGSVMPGPVGPNPSLTIAALADRFADRILGA